MLRGRCEHIWSRCKLLHERLSPRTTRVAFWMGGAALAFGAFVEITDEVMEASEIQAIDDAILVDVARLRTGWLTAFAVDVTALGSPTLIALHSILTLALLLVIKDFFAAAQLVSASVGAGILTVATKGFIERARPEIVPQLVDVAGYSYPSGHSVSVAAMYLTLGLLVSRHLPSIGARIVVLAMAGLVIALVAVSRVYLGVHYPSDILSGVSLGVAWALLLAGCFALLEREADEAVEHRDAVT